MNLQRVAFVIVLVLHASAIELIRQGAIPAWAGYLTLVASVTAGLLQVLPTSVDKIAASLVGKGGTGLGVLMLVGCGAGTPTPDQQKAVATDLESQAECVKNAKTRADADACRAEVKASRDSGAP